MNFFGWLLFVGSSLAIFWWSRALDRSGKTTRFFLAGYTLQILTSFGLLWISAVPFVREHGFSIGRGLWATFADAGNYEKQTLQTVAWLSQTAPLPQGNPPLFIFWMSGLRLMLGDTITTSILFNSLLRLVLPLLILSCAGTLARKNTLVLGVLFLTPGPTLISSQFLKDPLIWLLAISASLGINLLRRGRGAGSSALFLIASAVSVAALTELRPFAGLCWAAVFFFVCLFDRRGPRFFRTKVLAVALATLVAAEFHPLERSCYRLLVAAQTLCGEPASDPSQFRISPLSHYQQGFYGVSVTGRPKGSARPLSEILRALRERARERMVHLGEKISANSSWWRSPFACFFLLDLGLLAKIFLMDHRGRRQLGDGKNPVMLSVLLIAGSNWLVSFWVAPDLGNFYRYHLASLWMVWLARSLDVGSTALQVAKLSPTRYAD